MESNTKTILTKETIEKIMQKHFGEQMRVQSVTELTEGWFNAIYMVAFMDQQTKEVQEVVLKTGVQDSKYVMSYEQDIMRAEVDIYDLLKDTIIPTPEILVRDFSRSLTDCNYFIMEKLLGDNWGHLAEKISPQNNEKLIAKIAQYTAALHQVKGSYFGYVRRNESFHYPSWRTAFESMVNLAIEDGKKEKVELPYDKVLETFEPLWSLLDEIEEPCLVNFDMWTKNIMLVEKDEEYVIDGVIDHERAFYGDPYADFIASGTICGDVEKCELFQKNYSLVSGKPFTYTHNDRVRLAMYSIYLCLLMGVEVYRYNEEDTKNMLEECRTLLKGHFTKLDELLSKD